VASFENGRADCGLAEQMHNRISLLAGFDMARNLQLQSLQKPLACHMYSTVIMYLNYGKQCFPRFFKEYAHEHNP